MSQDTDKIIEIFGQIDAVPRCSKHEEKISRWLCDWAAARGLEHRADSLGNVVMVLPAGEGFESAPTVVIQGHMDMVCEKTPDSPHDFSRDPIRVIREGDWLHADRTTLGADNGIAIAMALALHETGKQEHPRLELLFTVDEEQGLTGANRLEPGFVSGRTVLNLDSEDEGVFTVGCAGGQETAIRLPLELGAVEPGSLALNLTVGGLRGGHSGVDIHKQRASANKLLARLLDALAAELPLRLTALKGGSAHNAIPRDASATVALPKAGLENAVKLAAAFEKTARAEYAAVENTVEIKAAGAGPATGQAVTVAGTRRAVDLLLALPHGVVRMSSDIPGLVETSTNMATLRIENGALHVLNSQRSSVTSRLAALCTKVGAICRLAGAEVTFGSGYPAWQPDMHSPLLARCQRVYHGLFGREAKVEVIHAGLETAVLGARYSGMDMISLGPTIQNPHCPEERVNVPSIDEVWKFLLAILKSFRG
ncbi:aminoacyl-histidine dipeptidase [bacterium]|nr:aminoacyl-histidine dipeptidase [bacterium]